MDPQLRLVIGGILVVIAIAFSLIMFPRLNDQIQELERNAALTPSPAAGATPSP